VQTIYNGNLSFTCPYGGVLGEKFRPALPPNPIRKALPFPSRTFPRGEGECSRPSCSHPEQGPAPNGFVDRPNGDPGGGGLPDTPFTGGTGSLFLRRWAFPRRPHAGQVCRRTYSCRASGKGTPPHGRWGGVGAWGSPAQGEVRMVPYLPTATKVPLP